MLRMRLRLVALLSGTALLVALGAAPAVHAATTLYVGPGGGSGGCAGPAYSDIANAVGAATAGDTIHVCAGTYDLAAAVTVDKDLAFVGDGAATTVVDGGGTVLLFHSTSQVLLSITGLTLRNGWGLTGGAIAAIGSVSVTDSTLSGNVAHFIGGGIFTGGSVTVTNSTFSGNSAAVDIGGGIYTIGSVTVTNSTFSGNHASWQGGAIRAGSVTATNSTFSANSADNGGAIEAGNATITNSTFNANVAGVGGGAVDATGTVTVAGSTFGGNDYDAVHTTGSADVRNSTFSGNHGAAVNATTATVMNSTFSVNDGSGVRTTSATTITDSTFNGNRGSAVEADGAITVANSTFSENAAGFRRTVVEGSAVAVTNSTFSGNWNMHGGQGVISATGGSGVIANTIISGLSLCTGITTDGGGNFVTQPDCLGTLTTAAALALGPLANNGGPTQTIAIGPTSVALDAGVDATCAAAPVNGRDQRGVTRPQGARCDAGAFERVPSLAITRVSPLSGPVGTAVTITGGNFSMANAVTFNGIPASFSVRSPSIIVTTVPAGATTGYIRVTTRTGLSATSSPYSFFVLR